MKYKLTFKHLVEETYEVEFEADSLEEANELAESPFDLDEVREPVDVNGLSIEVLDVEEIT